MALLTVQNITRAGVTPTYAAVAASDTFAVDSANTFIHVKNAGGSADSCVPVVATGVGPAGLTLSSAAVSVTNGQERMIGPFPSQYFADPVTGLMTITHGFTTSVTAGVFKLIQP